MHGTDEDKAWSARARPGGPPDGVRRRRGRAERGHEQRELRWRISGWPCTGTASAVDPPGVEGESDGDPPMIPDGGVSGHRVDPRHGRGGGFHGDCRCSPGLRPGWAHHRDRRWNHKTHTVRHLDHRCEPGDRDHAWDSGPGLRCARERPPCQLGHLGKNRRTRGSLISPATTSRPGASHRAWMDEDDDFTFTDRRPCPDPRAGSTTR